MRSCRPFVLGAALTLVAAPARAAAPTPWFAGLLAHLVATLGGEPVGPVAPPGPQRTAGPGPRLDSSPPSWRAAAPADPGTPTLGARLLGVRVDEDRAELRWLIEGDAPEVTVHRRETGGAWRTVGVARPDAAREVAFVDTRLEPGVRYTYSLGTGRAGAESFGGAASVVARGGPPLAVRALRADAAGGGAVLDVSVPAVGCARVELADAEGRVAWAHAWTPLAAGPQTVRVGREALPAPGPYTVRLAQGARLVTGWVVLGR
jgi:hypothetical protein